MHTSTTTSSSGLTSFASTTSCAATTRLPVAQALPQPCHASSCRSASRRSVALALAALLLVVWIAPALLRLCRASERAVSTLDCSSVGRTSSRRASGHCISRRDYSSSGLHRLHCAYVVHPDVPSRHSTSRRTVALALAVRLVTASRGATTRCPDCIGSTAPMSCIRTRRLAARLLVGRLHWLSPCVRSLRLAARLLVVRLAPALRRLCRVSGRAVSTLDFSSVCRTVSRRVPGHSVVS
jgi:hypothetical protein